MKHDVASKFHIRWTLVIYDIIVFVVTDAALIKIYGTYLSFSLRDIIINSALALASILSCRFFGDIYKQIWRFGGIQCYIKLLTTDFVSAVIFIALEYLLQKPLNIHRFSFAIMVALVCVDALLALGMRMMYRYCFKCGNELTPKGKFLRLLLRIFSNAEVKKNDESQKIKTAIVGAGTAGVSLAEDFLNNSNSAYTPRCFIDESSKKSVVKFTAFRFCPKRKLHLKL